MKIKHLFKLKYLIVVFASFIAIQCQASQYIHVLSPTQLDSLVAEWQRLQGIEIDAESHLISTVKLDSLIATLQVDSLVSVFRAESADNLSIADSINVKDNLTDNKVINNDHRNSDSKTGKTKSTGKAKTAGKTYKTKNNTTSADKPSQTPIKRSKDKEKPIQPEPQTADYKLYKKWNETVEYTPELLDEEISEYMTAYPALIKVDTIGYSVEERPLFMLTMGNGPHHIFCLGTLHAREHVTTTLLMKDIEHIAYCMTTDSIFGDYNMKSILDSCTYYIVPMMNPDGVDIVKNGYKGRSEEFKDIPIVKKNKKHGYRSWKANAHGVDLNRNYANGWDNDYKGPYSPCSEGFRGDTIATEPEVKALIEALKMVQPEAVLSYHSQGEIFYASDPTPKAKSLLKKMIEISGYTRWKTKGAYGSLQDHVDKEYNIFYVCIELCPSTGPYPYPSKNFYKNVWPKARYLLPLAGEVMGNVKE